ncbi:MAG: ATP-binding cassette domain-containing protein [Amoebophilaceae bacterium]|jgi:ATP-binding cassette subfamily F protein 3|nr:ATP-binding cassette domain-containing protein [Amoebophilaceae bacterium]
MIVINDLTYQLGSKTLYEHASLHIKPKDKIGLVGMNGTGKSTLLRIIAGELTPDQGTISQRKDCTIGFLNQDLLSYQTIDSIRSVAMMAFDDAITVQKKIELVLHQLETHYQDSLVDQLAVLQEKFEQLGGYEIQAKTEAVLEGMGFSTQDLDRPLNEFSGGWRMRVMLAKLLLQKPSLLLLDEPTNHLDITSIQWVENYLKSHTSAFIVVSHDRSFLDQVATKTVEVAQQQLHVYMGNYTFYEQEKDTRAALQQNAYTNQQKKIKQTEDFIERFRSKASKAKQVQSRIKSLDRIDKVAPLATKASSIKFKLSVQQQPGRLVASLEHVAKSFGLVAILKDAHAKIERGDKIALIGANGKGKSTLLRIIAGVEATNAGESILGHNVNVAFYAQHQLEALNLDHTILAALKHTGAARTETELRSIAGMFLFTKDDVFKKIGVLSGGEKSRVALAKVLLSEANFLLLDEPTNHLDMVSINILAQTLQQYTGTYLLVSHDRHFVSQVATKIWYIEDTQIKEYPGTYDEYTYWRQQSA